MELVDFFVVVAVVVLQAISSRISLSRAVENISDGFVCICLIRQGAAMLSQGLAASLENIHRKQHSLGGICSPVHGYPRSVCSTEAKLQSG